MTALPSTLWMPDGFDPQFNDFIDLVTSWNRRINVVSRKLTRDDLRRHALSSLAPLQLMPEPQAPIQFLDIGSGGGFPAFPLLLARPAWSAVLVEATRKKCLFLRDVGERLTPGRVRVLNGRYEGLPIPTWEAPEDPERPEWKSHEPGGAGDRFDLITLRAVAPDERFMSRAGERLRRDLSPGGLLAWYAPQDQPGQRQALDALTAVGCEGVALVRVEWAGATLAAGRGPAA